MSQCTPINNSVIRTFPNSLCPIGKIHDGTPGCKCSLLKVRKGKYKGKPGVDQVESGGQESVLFLLRYF
jgi:hypothetical protein